LGAWLALAENVVIAQPTAASRVIAAWPSFALIDAYELPPAHCTADAGPLCGDSPVAGRPRERE